MTRVWWWLVVQSVAFRSMRRNLGVNSTVCSLYGGCPTSDFAYDTSINAELLIYQANITKVNGKLLNLTSESPRLTAAGTRGLTHRQP